ncbi:hypothetical protein HV319_12310 [Citrobacter freundii]|uniref:hypothetical protein n=1 Tax=Citrobacter freundii complex TaxID=1344959 RepID=UPI0015E9FDF0|nr:hypothetical protein [Citrobacter freundii]QLR92226.1 hypothetical protein HV330_12290 [Citrobacter freundii]QLS40009.1 hypothetical protein HV319_12310 [Citrobacter freundii]
MMTPAYLGILAIYLLGFVGMYFYSLKRDAECSLERNPREAFLFAFFWPALVLFIVAIIFFEKIIKLAYAACGNFRSKLRGKH